MATDLGAGCWDEMEQGIGTILSDEDISSVPAFYGPREFAEADDMLPRAGFSYRSKGWEETVCSQLIVMIRCYQSDFPSSWCI